MISNDLFLALDYKTGHDVHAALRDVTVSVIIIIVIQRIGTVRNIDKILVADKGEIVSIGTHDEFFASSLAYRETALPQLSERGPA